MANTQGGAIVLSVAEKVSGLVWEGVPDAAQLRTVLWGQLNDRHKVSANLLRDDDLRTVEDSGPGGFRLHQSLSQMIKRNHSRLARQRQCNALCH